MFIATAAIGGGTPYLIPSAAAYTTSGSGLVANHTFSGIGLGPATPDRILIACAWIYNTLGNGLSVSSIQFNGVPATMAVQRGPTSGATQFRTSSAIAYMPFPSGTSVDCRVNTSGTEIQLFGVHIFALYRARNSAPFATNGSLGTVVADVSASLSVPSGGIYLVGGSAGGSAAIWNWANADQDFNIGSTGGFHGWNIRQAASTPTFIYERAAIPGSVTATMCLLSWR